MLVSVCIPTRDRPKYLKGCLEKLLSFAPSSWEVVVSDNSSTDEQALENESIALDGRKLFHGLRYVRQDGTLSAEASFLAALRAGTAPLRVYLADDDQLIPGGIRAAVGFMTARPEVSVAYAPWELYDAVDDACRGTFYSTVQRLYRSTEQADLFNAVIEGHIFPEIAVWRSTALDYIQSSAYAYSAFLTLSNLVKDGRTVAFLERPFYRFVTRHQADDREQAGPSMALVALDAYRGGLELLAPVVDDGVRRQMDRFMRERLEVVRKLLVTKGRYEDASIVLRRIRLSEGRGSFAETGLNEGEEHFYRCRGCDSLRTILQVRQSIKNAGIYCPCGSRRASPGWPSFWEWLKPNVLWLAFRLKTGSMPKCA